jgi:hypothetical protein
MRGQKPGMELRIILIFIKGTPTKRIRVLVCYGLFMHVAVTGMRFRVARSRLKGTLLTCLAQ